MAYIPSVRLETTTYTGGGHRYTDTRLRDVNVPVLDHQDQACLKELYCGPVKGTAAKVARVVLWTGTGAAVGGTFFGPPGAGVGSALGLGIGFCTLL